MNDIQLIKFDGDLLIVNGDFVIADSDKQNVNDIVNDAKGEWKDHPFLGVGLIYYQNSNSNNAQITNALKTELQKDGFIVPTPTYGFDPITNKKTINLNPYRL